jgi:hypothetical protein
MTSISTFSVTRDGTDTVVQVPVEGGGTSTQMFPNVTITPLSSIADLVRLYSTTTSIPSKRSNKNKSGRRGLKQFRSAQTLQAVGGFTDDIKAIAAPADHHMCVTYEEWAEREAARQAKVRWNAYLQATAENARRNDSTTHNE